LSERASPISESERAIPLGVTRGRRSRNSHHPLVHPPHRLVFRNEGFERRAPLVVPPLVEPASHRPFQAVDLGSQSGIPGDLPLPPQPVFQAYFILNTGRYRRPWVVTRTTFGSRCRQSLQNGSIDVLNARVDCHPVVQFRIERNLIFQVNLEFGTVSAPEIRANRWVLRGRATRWSELSAEQ